jgi:UDP-N-acetylglucosamine/UDP-N-acetylgalactosamine diphosphorylase
MDIPVPLRDRLALCGQAHVLAFWDRLGVREREALLADLQSLDLDQLAGLIKGADACVEEPPEALEPLPQIVKGADEAADARAREEGEHLLSAGRVAAFVVAGGQGTRLGHPGPKGTYPATPLRGRPLFAVFADQLLALGKRYGRPIPWYVMTSPQNDEETRDFFARHGSFDLDPEDIVFLTQGTMPAIDARGRLILEAPHRLFRSPDGHGGSLLALHRSGALADMERRGVQHIFYFQVDNPLVEICDPVFLGYHAASGSEFSSKAVPKRDPEEKVGVLVRRGGRPAVIEYSDLSTDLRDARDQDGQLRFRAGNIATHVLSRPFVERLNEGRFALPFHVAKKSVPGLGDEGRPTEHAGTKFETFVFDALPLAERVMVMEVRRETEFSPIKNRDGADSAFTSANDQVARHAAWLEEVGVEVPRGADGRSLHLIEISPQVALCAADLIPLRDRIPDRLEGHCVIARGPPDPDELCSRP